MLADITKYIHGIDIYKIYTARHHLQTEWYLLFVGGDYPW